MCGIAGICATEPKAALSAAIEDMNSTLPHRGPDGGGVYANDGIALGHRRLSIIELSDLGAQPMVSSNQRYVMTYNGEVYNFKELRATLEKEGCRFRGHSDSEVVLEAYARWGSDAFSRFNGMYALAVWDSAKKKLTLARDRFGIKPLYYYHDGKRLIFASEIKAILTAIGHTPPLCKHGLVEYLHYGITHGKHTLFEKIHKLEAGHFLDIDHTVIETNADLSAATAFWSLDKITKHNPSRTEAVSVVRQKLEEAVQRHLIADVPVGLFLSGGLDSTTICALASNASDRKLQTWSVEFESQSANSELERAREVADRYETDHHELSLNFNNLKEVIEQLSTAHDQPFADAANVPLYLMTQALGGETKVVLQGDGGDEIFGGYSRYRLLQYRQLWRLLSPLTALTARLPAHSRTSQRIHRMLSALSTGDNALSRARLLTEEVSAHSVQQLLRPEIAAQLGQYDPYIRYRALSAAVDAQSASQAMLWTDTKILLPDQFLEKVDRSTMANSIEVRVPMLDNELTDYVMGLPASMKLAGSSKSLLREAAADLLPESVTEGRKLGFGVPYAEWLSGPLASFTKERILAKNGLLSDLFSEQQLETLLQDNVQQKGFRGFMLYKALMLAVWSEQHNVRMC